MAKRYVFMLFGYPGSGKSFVADWLTSRFNAVRLRTDDLRIMMFAGDRPELHTPENKALVNNALRYAFQQIMRAGNDSVVLDANHNQRRIRTLMGGLARRHGAVAVVVWVRTPEGIAQQRIQDRAEAAGFLIFDPNVIQRMKKVMQPHGKSEYVIVLDGLMSAKDQQAAFNQQFQALNI